MLGKAFTSKRVVATLAGVQALDALFNVLPSRWIEADLEHLRLPQRFRYVFGSVKAASAGGLVIGLSRPQLGRTTARWLVAYFLLALGAHKRIHDRPVRYAPALAMLGWSAVAERWFAARPVAS